jgi:hypothetical protein
LLVKSALIAFFIGSFLFSLLFIGEVVSGDAFKFFRLTD